MITKMLQETNLKCSKDVQFYTVNKHKYDLTILTEAHISLKQWFSTGLATGPTITGSFSCGSTTNHSP